ncbi:hypothetical protein CRYUN_Cryun14cG0074800 [Craigia yunnanensis]
MVLVDIDLTSFSFHLRIYCLLKVEAVIGSKVSNFSWTMWQSFVFNLVRPILDEIYVKIGKGECGINSCSGSSSFGAVDEDKCKKTNSRKPPKPPRRPKGPLLDAADQKLVSEIAELAMRKHARMKRDEEDEGTKDIIIKQ